MKKSRLLGALCAVVSSFITLPSQAALISVLGGQAYYDDVANLTWLTSPNAIKMNWANANAWAAGLDIGGITDWRLPDVKPINGTTEYDATNSYSGDKDIGYNISAPGTLYAGSHASEMAYMFYNTLGNLAWFDTLGNGPQPGWGLSNTGEFNSLKPFYYWSSKEQAHNTINAWIFNFYNGDQDGLNKGSLGYSWAVRSGGSELVSSIPIPASVWLFGSGLLGLIGVARRKTPQWQPAHKPVGIQ